MRSKRSTKTPLGRALLGEAPEVGSPRERENSGTRASPPRRPSCPPAQPPQRRAPPTAGIGPRRREVRARGRRAWGWGAQGGGGSGGERRGVDRGGGAAQPRAPPPAWLLRRAPTCPARFLQPCGRPALCAHRSRVGWCSASRTPPAPAARPPPPCRRGPSAAR